MTITCDTPLESLLDVNDIKEKVETYTKIIESKNRNLYETIVNEQNRGLSKDSFYIDNNPMLFEKSETIKKKLENIEDQISSRKENILSIAEEKRTEEIEELKRKVAAKRNQLYLEWVALNNISLGPSIGKPQIDISRKQEIEDKLKYYTEKYNQLLTLK